jgi:hypothetical protein
MYLFLLGQGQLLIHVLIPDVLEDGRGFAN